MELTGRLEHLGLLLLQKRSEVLPPQVVKHSFTQDGQVVQALRVRVLADKYELQTLVGVSLGELGLARLRVVLKVLVEHLQLTLCSFKPRLVVLEKHWKLVIFCHSREANLLKAGLKPS